MTYILRACAAARILGVATALAVLWLMAYSSPALCVPAMGPGMAPQIERLVKGNADEYPLPDGWGPVEYEFLDNEIIIDIGRKGGEGVRLRAVVFQLASSLREVGRSANFRIELIEPAKPDSAQSAAASAIALRIKANDTPALFLDPAMKNGEGPFERAFQRYLFMPVLLAGLIALAAFMALSAKLIRDELLPEGGFAKIALLAIAAAGLFLRVSLWTPAPIHNNGHGIRELRAIIYSESAEQKEVMYDRVYITAMRQLSRLAGGGDDGVFRANMALGALAVIAMFMAVRGLTGSSAAGFFAASLYAFSPVQVTIAASESPMPMYGLFSLLGLALLSGAARTADRKMFAAACAALAFAASMRFLTMLIIPAAAVLMIALLLESKRCRDQKFRFDSFAAVCAIALAAWATFHFMAMTDENISKGAARISLDVYLHNMRSRNILADPTLTPWILPFAGAAGYIVCWLKKPALAAALTAVFAIIVPASFTCVADRSDLIRYQSEIQWLFYLAAGCVALAVPERKTARTAFSVATVALTVFAASRGLSAPRSENEDAIEYKFMTENARKLDPGATIYLPVRSTGIMATEFPDYISRTKIRRYGDPPPASGSEVYVYIGLDCYRRENAEDNYHGSMRPECAQIIESQNLKTLIKKSIRLQSNRTGFNKRYFEFSTESPKIYFLSGGRAILDPAPLE